MTIRTFIVAAIALLCIAGTGLGERGGAFSVEQKLTGSDSAKGDWFGSSVAISGETVLVGTFNGSAYIYERQADGSWSETSKLTASDGVDYHYFGYSVAISGEIALVGAYADDDNGPSSGSAYIYERQADGSWSEVAKLTASDGAGMDYFGYSVAISGETALVGAYFDDDNGNRSGSAYIYQRQADDSWSEVAKLTASDAAEEDWFGHSVGIFGEMALVGAYRDDDNGNASGSAYIYQRQADDSWSEVAKLTASDGNSNDRFGHSVAISGEMALVGAHYDNDNGNASGSAYIYQRQADGSWIEVAKLTASDAADGDFFGYSVAISGYYAVSGAPEDDMTEDDADNAGSAYIYGPPAPPATGACCVHTGCEILTIEQCSNMGGVFMAGESCEECDPVCFADINGDGTVDVNDLLALIGAWGDCP